MNIRSFRNNRPKIDASAYVDETAVIIGEVSLASDVSIWPLCVLRADINSISIGARSNVQDGAVVHVVHDYELAPGGYHVTIGADTTIGHGVVLHGCQIGDRCLIGMNATVLDGAVIEDDVIIGANSLVPQNKVLETGYLYFGNPVRKVRPIKSEERSHIKTNADLYVGWKNEFMQEYSRYAEFAT